MPALRSAVFVPTLRSYATTTPGSSATTLLPSSHCSRSASNASPPVSTTRIFGDAQHLAHELGQRALLLLDDEVVGRRSRPDRPRPRAVDDLREQRDEVAVAHRDDGVEVHVAARLRQVHREHDVGRTGAEQRTGDPQHGLRRGALTHADHHRAGCRSAARRRLRRARGPSPRRSRRARSGTARPRTSGGSGRSPP